MIQSKDSVTAEASDHSSEPWATLVSYDSQRDEIRLDLDTGSRYVIPRQLIEELRDCPTANMFDLTLIGDGEALASEADDVHIYVPGLIRDFVEFRVSGIP